MVKINEIIHIRSFCCIILDTGSQYWIRKTDLCQSGFCEGSEYEQQDFLQKISMVQYPRALNHSVSLLARRPYSKKELFSKLIRLRYTDDVANLVIYKLEKEKLLNDREFCDQWIRFRLSCHYGISLIRRELRIKGISDDMIIACLEHLNPDEELDNAVSLARKAWKRVGHNGNLFQSRRKVIASLLRKGYDLDTAKSACNAAEDIK